MSIHIQTTSPRETVKNGVLYAEPEDTILGKDDFLRILIAQLQNQDPLNPMDDREFIAQMAQFSQLEQMTNMNTAIQQFVHAQESGALVQHSELIGEQVKWERTLDADEYRQETVIEENRVISVRKEQDGKIQLLLDNDRWIESGQLRQIGLPNRDKG